MKMFGKCLSMFFSLCILSVAVGSFSVVSADDSFIAERVRVLELVNEERAKVGAEPLVLNKTLTEAADLRAEEITEVFSHTRPDETSCFTVLDEYGIEGLSYGENIAAGSRTADSVMNLWINSTGHYNNMINSDYSEIGIGICYDPDTQYGFYWVQLFIEPLNPVSKTADINSDSRVDTADITDMRDCLTGNGKSDVLLKADVNADGKINIFDLIVIKRKVFYGLTAD